MADDEQKPEGRPLHLGKLDFGEPDAEARAQAPRTCVMWDTFHRLIDSDPQLLALVSHAGVVAYNALQSVLADGIDSAENPQMFILARHAAMTAALTCHTVLTARTFYRQGATPEETSQNWRAVEATLIHLAPSIGLIARGAAMKMLEKALDDRDAAAVESKAAEAAGIDAVTAAVFAKLSAEKPN